MKKSDLKTGMIVEARCGSKFLVMLNPECKDKELIDFNTGFLSLGYYSEDLRCANLYDGDVNGADYSMFDIIRIYSPKDYIAWVLKEKELTLSKAKLIWEREIPPVEMTIAEIEEKLGVKNLKIIKE